MTDLKVFGNVYNNVKGIKATDTDDAIVTFGEGGGVVQDAIGNIILGSDVGDKWTTDGIATGLEPNEAIILSEDIVTVANSAFYRKPITSVRGDSVTSVNDGAFNGCSQMTEIIFPKLKTIANTAFNNCTMLAVVNLPSVTSIGSSFQYTGNSGVAVLPKVTSLNQTFRNSNFKVLDLGVYAGIGNYFVTSDTQFDTLILRKTDAICTLSNINGFAGSKFASGGAGGTLYVPQALKSQYEQATNWSTILGYPNNQILAIEGSYYETHYADGSIIE